jgi:hypothetical protein
MIVWLKTICVCEPLKSFMTALLCDLGYVGGELSGFNGFMVV